MTMERRFASSAESFWGKKGPVDGIAADPIYLDVSVPPGKRKTLAGRDHPPRLRLRLRRDRESSATPPAPLAVPTEGVGWADTAPPAEADNRSLVLFDRGDEVTVQAGRRRDPVPAGFGKAAGGAGGVVRPDRHEYPGAASAGVRGAERRHVPQVRKLVNASVED